MHTVRCPLLAPAPPQIRRSVLDGKRPQVPAPEALPGADCDGFVHLAAYIELMR